MVPEHAEFVPLAEALGRAAATIEQPHAAGRDRQD